MHRPDEKMINMWRESCLEWISLTINASSMEWISGNIHFLQVFIQGDEIQAVQTCLQCVGRREKDAPCSLFPKPHCGWQITCSLVMYFYNVYTATEYWATIPSLPHKHTHTHTHTHQKETPKKHHATFKVKEEVVLIHLPCLYDLLLVTLRQGLGLTLHIVWCTFLSHTPSLRSCFPRSCIFSGWGIFFGRRSRVFTVCSLAASHGQDLCIKRNSGDERCQCHPVTVPPPH